MGSSLILGWDKQHATALSGTVSGGSVRVVNAISWDWPAGANPQTDPVAAAKFLKQKLQDAGVVASSAYFCLPRQEAVIRQLELPNIPDEELPEIVKLQAATKSSVPVENLLIDFLPLPHAGGPTRSVLVATINTNLAKSIQKVFATAEIELEGIGLGSVGLAELALRTSPPETGQTLLAVSLGKSRLELNLIRENQLLLTHSTFIGESVSADKAVAAEINRVLVSARPKLGELTVGPVAMFATSRDDFPQLQETYGNRLTVVNVFDSPLLQFTGNPPAAESAEEFLGPAGILLHRQTQQLAGLDFLHPRKKFVAKSNRNQKLALYGGAAVTALGLILYLFNSYLGNLDTTIEELETKQAGLIQTLADGKPTLEANSDLQEWLDRDADLLAEIDKFQQTLPGTQAAYLNKFQYDVSLGKNLSKYVAIGLAVERDVVEKMYREFDTAGFDVTPKEIPTSRRDSDYPWSFDLILDRPPVAKQAPVKPVATATVEGAKS